MLRDALRARNRPARASGAHKNPPGTSVAAPMPDGGLLSPATRRRELVLVVVVLAIHLLGTVVAASDQAGQEALGAGTYALLVLGALVLPLRHRHPLGVLALTFLAAQVYWAQDLPRGPVFVAWLVASTHVMLIGRRFLALTTLVVGFTMFATVGHLLGNAEPPTVASLFYSLAWTTTLIAVTEAVRIRRDRAVERVRSEAEALRRQVADERLRMARDLHDAVAHNMSLISIQAGVALHLLESDRAASGNHDRAAGNHDLPEQVGDALATIRYASKEALVELRSVLGVLRQVDEGDDGEGEGGGAPPRTTSPSLTRLDDLVARARSVGVSVQVSSQADVPVDDLPRAVDQAAFRIIQESLTNVSRHSGAETARIRIRLRDGALLLEIVDNGAGPARSDPELPHGGNGIVGLRARAAAVGGRLRAESRPGGGFAVRAELPLGTGTGPTGNAAGKPTGATLRDPDPPEQVTSTPGIARRETP
jgi:signal transduction histidine kinase